VIVILSRRRASQFEKTKMQVVLTVDDVFLRSEWTNGVPTVSSRKLRPEEDLRILDMLKDLQIQTTLFVSGIVAELFPNVVMKLARDGFEIASHGYRHENLVLLKDYRRRQCVEKALDLLEKCIGKKVLGWRSPGLHIDSSIYEILKTTHIRWCSNVELPMRFMRIPFMYKGKMEIPISSVDLRLYENGLSPSRVCQHWLSSLDQKKIFTVIIHPWVQLHNDERRRSLGKFLELASSKEDVRFCKGSDVYEQYLSQRPSLYGAALSTGASIWKRFSGLAQGPLSRARKVFSRYA
jgi:peptidoglycan/xylan/chitin deacetylase (PgdA/CDA1 family)